MEMLSVWNIYNASNFNNIKVTLFYCRVDLLRNYEDVHVCIVEKNINILIFNLMKVSVMMIY